MMRRGRGQQNQDTPAPAAADSRSSSSLRSIIIVAASIAVVPLSFPLTTVPLLRRQQRASFRPSILRPSSAPPSPVPLGQ